MESIVEIVSLLYFGGLMAWMAPKAYRELRRRRP